MLFVEADEIAPNLWQGSYPGTGTAVKASGFSMLVLCAEEFQDPAEDFPGVEVVHAANYDDGQHNLTPELLTVAVTAAHRVKDAVEKGRKVLVTCRMGINRSGLVTAFALHLIYGWAGAACVARVKKMRHRYQGFEPLHNWEFVSALKRLPARSQVKEVPPDWQQTPSGLIVPV